MAFGILCFIAAAWNLSWIWLLQRPKKEEWKTGQAMITGYKAYRTIGYFYAEMDYKGNRASGKSIAYSTLFPIYRYKGSANIRYRIIEDSLDPSKDTFEFKLCDKWMIEGRKVMLFSVSLWDAVLIMLGILSIMHPGI